MGFGQWTREERKARKQYICEICENSIEIGQLYIHWKSAGIDDETGKFIHSESRAHNECQQRVEKEAEWANEEYDWRLDHLYHV